MVKRSATVSSTSGQQMKRSPSSSLVPSPLQSESESEHKPQTKQSRAKKSKPNSSTDSLEKEKQKRDTSITITNEIKTMMIEQAMDLAYRQLPFEEIGTQVCLPPSQWFKAIGKLTVRPVCPPVDSRHSSRKVDSTSVERPSRCTPSLLEARISSQKGNEERQRGSKRDRQGAIHQRKQNITREIYIEEMNKPSWQARHSVPFGNHKHSTPMLQLPTLSGSPLSITKISSTTLSTERKEVFTLLTSSRSSGWGPVPAALGLRSGKVGFARLCSPDCPEPEGGGAPGGGAYCCWG